MPSAGIVECAKACPGVQHTRFTGVKGASFLPLIDLTFSIMKQIALECRSSAGQSSKTGGAKRAQLVRKRGRPRTRAGVGSGSKTFLCIGRCGRCLFFDCFEVSGGFGSSGRGEQYALVRHIRARSRRFLCG